MMLAIFSASLLLLFMYLMLLLERAFGEEEEF